MKIHYTGKLDPLEKQQQKNLDTHFAKIGKLVDKKGEREAHVMLTSQRYNRKAEVTMNYFGKQACGTATHKDQFFALLAAIDKLETQMHKLRDKWLDVKRHGDSINGKKTPLPAAPEPKPKKLAGYGPAKVQRSSKPLSLEEAPLALKPASSYLVFEEAGSSQIYVLARRADGGLDLIEAR